MKLQRIRRVARVLMVAVAFAVGSGIPAFADPPSSSSIVGDTVDNPITGMETTVTSLVVDPASTPTAGDTAFVQTADGYTFLVKSAGEIFYNDDTPPVPFTITEIIGTEATVTSPEATEPFSFPTEQTTANYDAAFSSSTSTDPTTPPVVTSGPDGVAYVQFGDNGSNGRAGALFVPPSAGGDGDDGPSFSFPPPSFPDSIVATTRPGLEVGSVGGNGGTGGDSVFSFWNGQRGGNGGDGGDVTVTQGASSSIQTSGDDNYGIIVYSRSGFAGDGGDAILAPGGGAGGASADGGDVVVNVNGVVSTSGENAYGVYAQSVGNNGGEGGNQWGLVGVAGGGGAPGNGGTVTVNTFDGAQIFTSGDFAHGILAQSVGGTGGTGGFSGNLLVSLAQNNTDPGGDANTVTVSNGGLIQTTGDLSRGIMAQSIGGGGGAGGSAGGLFALALGGVTSGGGSGSTVTVTNTGTGEILTTGSASDGIMAQSIGGSGGAGVNTSGVLVGLGGSGSNAGSGSTVNVSNLGSIRTTGTGARGIVAQSIGGGGGDGGSSTGLVAVGGDGAGGGAGGTVNVTNDGIITTEGDDAMGILAQSVGGGGGNGGSTASVGLFAGVAIGGSGGGGGDGGDVNVVLSDTDSSQPSQIVTEGDRSTGVFVQSVGGGGGNGGGAVQVSVGFIGAASVAVGGSAGDGGEGGTVILTGTGDASVQTGGADAFGVLMQSVGGGGGNGGYAVSAAASAGPVSGSVSVGVGGEGGQGGDGGEVRVGTVDGDGNLTAPGFSGTVVTTGERSVGMAFQSIGGGGGNGGLAVAASGGGSLIFSGSVSVGVGGSGDVGGTGGLVRVYTDSNITTTGNSSTALLAQSVGGGGGNGGGSVAAGVNGSAGGAAGIGVSVGGSGAGGGAGGDVTVIAEGTSIRTSGQFSTAVVVQSIGGGGGNGGFSVAASGAGAGAGAGTVNVAVGGAADNGGAGGIVDARVDAAVSTAGDDSGAILIQSIGGGGGNGGFSVAAGAAGGGAGAGAVSVGLGGSGGAGGAGGTVTAEVNGAVSTEGDRSAGVVAQSIGGGGGNGGFAVSGTVSGAGVGSGSVSVGLGGAGDSGGAGGQVTATVAEDVTTEGDDSTGVLAQSVGGGGGNGGFSVAGSISGAGTGSGAVSVGLGGSGGTGAGASLVTLTTDGDVSTQGDRSSGVVAQSIGGGGGNGGFSVSGSIAGAGVGAGTVAVGLGGDGAGGGAAGDVVATSNGTILTFGFASSGFVAQSIGGGGGNGGFNVSAAVAGGGTGAGSVAVGLGGSGAGGGNGGAVTAATNANIETRGIASTGVLAQSIGGGGGNGGFNVSPSLSGAGVGSGAISVGLGGSGAGGGDGGVVGLTVANSVLTRGNQSSAVVAQSVGGGGGNGGFNVSVSGTGAGTGSGAIGVGLGGRGGAGGDGDSVTSNVTGDLTTLGDTSSGLLVQSLGGGGGNGGVNVTAAIAVAGVGSGGASVGLGGAGGSGGSTDTATVTSVLTGNVATVGSESSGVVVQSLGGGGGNGGVNVSGIITAAGTGSGGVSVGIGGSGGDGGDAGATDSTITGNVSTLGENAGGVLVQSAGGGGGNGGVNVSAAVNLSGTGGGAAAVGLGGSGGGGGFAGTATSRMTGNITTAGADSAALTVQSLGGGGGNGGLNVSGVLSAAGTGSGAVSVGVGGFGGDGGAAAAASGQIEGDITTEGDRSGGMLVQSAGGGGGNGGISVSAAVSLAGTGSGVASVGVGGAGGGGGNGAAATGSVTGDVVTLGEDSSGVTVQSLGGGGGNGGINISAGLTASGSGGGGAAIGVGGFGGDGGDAAAATGTIEGDVTTVGDRSAGVLVQSAGGGGGNGGLNVSGLVTVSGSGGGGAAVGVGGFGGGGGAAGTATGQMTGDLSTFGADAAGFSVQSLGGGGGNGGINISGALSASGSAGGAAALGVGGFGGSGGAAAAADGTLVGDVATVGDRSGGVLVQSAGGGGGNGGLNVSGAVSLASGTSGAAALGVGGMGGGGGNADTATGAVTGDVSTTGADSTAIMVQSVGGGGGNGGMNVSAAVSVSSSGSGAAGIGLGGFGGSGGDGAAAAGTFEGDITTEGDRSGGVLVQSLGGGGGNGGINVSAAVNLSGSSGGAVGLGVGGFGGGGGDASTATGSMTGDVTTVGANATGVMVQSLGGGGGNGGLNVSGAVSITGSGSGAAALGVGGFGGSGGLAGDVTGVYVGTTLTSGDRSAGVVAQSLGGGGGNGGINVSAGISLAPSYSGAVSLGVGGFGGGGGAAGSVDHTVTGYVETSGDDSIGILSQSLGGGGGNGGLNVSGAVSLSRSTSAAVGIGVGGFGGSGADAGELTASDVTGGVMTFGERSIGIATQSLGGGGGNGGTNVSGALNLTQQDGGAAALGVGGFGGGGGNAGAVNSTVATTVDNNSIMTVGVDSIAVLAQSVGGGGGAGGVNVSGAVGFTGQSGASVALGLGGFGGSGGDADTVSLDVTGTVQTLGDRSHGLMAQSLGGGGGTGGTNVSGTMSFTKPSGSDTIFSVSAGVGGFGGGGGDAGAVDLSYSGALTALPRTINSDGSTTLNETFGANGIVAQSIGGGGGDGGINVSAGVAISSRPGAGQSDSSSSYAAVVGVGGFGGTGGNAGTVTVDIAEDSTIRAHGTGRSGIMAQSVGGGGGNGGLNVSAGIVSDTSLIVGVGGFGGNAGTADDVTVTARADIDVTTDPDDFGEPDDTSFEATLRDIFGDTVVDAAEDMVESKGLKNLFVDLGLFKDDSEAPETEGSAGLLAQSIGGGGGNGGLNVSGGIALSKDGKIPSITFGVGGFGGSGNTSGDVSVDHAGTITVEGNWKHGIFAQSVAGGGGNGGLNISGQLNWGSSESTDGATDLSIVGGLGGTGGLGADAGNVSVISTGDITTEGYHARGLFAQSIGGGGGTGGMNVTAVGTKDSTPVGLGIGGTGAAGGDAGDVTVTRGTAVLAAGLIQTDGNGAHGIEASSIGGGGGDAGINAVIGLSKTTGSQSDSGTGTERKTPTNTGVDPSAISNYNAVLDELEGNTGTPAGTGGKSVNSAVIAIGGSAGNAGNGGTVSVTHFGNITTAENNSHGVFAQSLGGGGGNAAFNMGMIYEAGNAEQNRGFGLAIGGGTGDGGSGGSVTVANTGLVSTQGDDSHGIFAQSVGGGGGNAVNNMLSQSGDGGNVGISIGRTGGTGGSASDVFASSDGTVSTQGARSHGLFAQSIGNGGGNSSSTAISLTTPANGDDKGDTFSLSVGLEGGTGGASGDVTAEALGFISTVGEDSHGIFAQSVGGGGGTGGGSKSSATSATSISIAIGGNGGTGGISGDVDVQNTAQITTQGDRSIGILAQSIGGAGGTGGFVKSGTSELTIAKNSLKGSEIGTTISINIGGDGGDGMTSGDVSVASGGLISTIGANAHGIHAQSVGGGGGSSGVVENTLVNLRSTIGTTATLSIGGSGGTGAVAGNVDVTNSSDIGTGGAKAAGIFAQSVGGGGGDAQSVRNIVAGADADNSSRNAILIGGSGGTGGAAGTVSVTNASGARIITDGDESHGIFAQSVGGGGGNGADVLSVSVSRPGSTASVKKGFQLGLGGSGGSGGTGSTVDVVNNGLIITRGDAAHGILAQSVGGGGGNGGYAITGTVTLARGTEADPTIALNIGGSGGDGNLAGDVTVTNTGQIDVSGEASFGVLAQSVGGGGGNGGMAIALSVNDLAAQARGQSFSKIAIGGAGGDGADGGDVTVNHSGTITVRGDNAYGIFAQSVGGSGGNAALSISTPAVMAADYVISTLLGARTGTDGTAGSVTVNSTGDIIVIGTNSEAIFTQSVNGGGGNVNTFLDFADDADASADPDVTVTSTQALGGEDLDGAAGSDVTQRHAGDLTTVNDRSTAMVVQSVGGGGGTATTTLGAGESADAEFDVTLGAIDTDNSPGGDVAAQRTGSVSTFGDLSGGGSVQSIGGGGGRFILAGGEGADGAGTRTGDVTLGADPSFFNDGGDIDLTLDGTIETTGDNASGQIVQSIGAGGGETYLTGLDSATVTLGAADDSTGDGGAIQLSNTGDVTTEGVGSYGFVLQSIGGGGGLIGTDLAPADLTVQTSSANGGDGGAIDFDNTGFVIVNGEGNVAVLAQSLGGGGGAADAAFRGSAGGAGSGGTVSLDLTGNVMALGEGGIAVMAQSEGRDGAGPIDVAIDGVVVGGAGGSFTGGSVPSTVGPAGLTPGTAAIVIDGGTDNTLSLSSDSFLTSLNNRILSGGSGNDSVTIGGTAAGNIYLGGGTNDLTIADGATFYAQDDVDLGQNGLLTINGDLFLGGTAFLTNGTLGGDTRASDFEVTQNIPQTTDVTGSLTFGSTAVYTVDVSFLTTGAVSGSSDLINVSGDAAIGGTVIPILNLLERIQPLVLIDADGSTADLGTTIPGTPVLTYSIGLNGPTGDGSTIDLNVAVDFTMPGMNRNQTNTALHINRVLNGFGTSRMGPVFGLIANLQTEDEVRDAIDRLTSEDYASTVADTFYAGRRFARAATQCDYYNQASRPGDERTCYWAQGTDNSVTRDSSFEYRRFESDSGALQGGARIPMGDDYAIGFAAGFEEFSMSNGERFTASGTRVALGLSLIRYQGPWEIYGALSGSTATYDATRVIGLSGTLPNGTVVDTGAATANQTVREVNLRLGAGYRYEPAMGNFYLRPGLDLDATYLYSGSFNEGTTLFGLEMADTSQWVMSATPSLEIGADMALNAKDKIRTFLRGEVSFANKDDVYIDGTFAGASPLDGTFRNYSGISGVTRSLIAGAVIYSDNNSAFVSAGYQGEWGDDLRSHSANVNFGFRF